MSTWWPRKRVILAIHRWLGAAAAIFLIVLALTGLALNHTERLGLDGIRLHSAWLLERYGMQFKGDETPVAFSAGEAVRIVYFRDTLIVDGNEIAKTSRPIGVVPGDPIHVVVTPDQLIYLGPDGSLVEAIQADTLPFDEITAVGHTSDGRPVLVAANGNWTPDEAWLEFRPYSGGYTVEPAAGKPLAADEAEKLAATYRGDGVSLYRVLLDLHSGRLFGWEGRTMMDLTAVAILLLVASGVNGWLRKSRGNGSGSDNTHP